MTSYKVVSENCNKTEGDEVGKKYVIFYTNPDIAPAASAAGFVLLYESSL